MATQESASADAAAPSYTKVFVGNLAFKTNESELAAEFSSCGKVVSANIITRGPRSLGYGFVEMSTEAEAKNAVQMMNKKSIDGRDINVELANPRTETEEKERPPRAARGGRGGFRGGRRYRPVRGGRGGFSGGRGGGAAGGSPSGGRNADSSAARTPSSTTLFVANLPFSVDDNGLTEVFKGLTIKKAHVVRKRNGRSKGFGFVEFDNVEEQQKALTAIDKKVVEGRELSVKVALTDDRNGEKDDGDTAANGEKAAGKEEPQKN